MAGQPQTDHSGLPSSPSISIPSSSSSSLPGLASCSCVVVRPFGCSSGERSMLYTVRFLSSVVAGLGRLARVLRMAMASVLLFSPAAASSSSVDAVPSPSPTARRKAAQFFPVRELEQLAACDGGGVEQLQGEATTKKKKAAWVARRRPSRLLIPAGPEASEAALFGEAMAEAEADVEVEGEGFCVASRRGSRHVMEDGYGVITEQSIGDSQLAFYGVYDGHGGRAAVDLVCSRLGSNVVAAVLAAETSTTVTPETTEDDQTTAAAWSTPADDDAVGAAIRAAYLATDGEFLSQGVRGGACAATALMKGRDLYVSNLGDCRAVMSRGGAAIALTSDQTAAREDERARIESTGGYLSGGGGGGGVWRVQGCLAVSRAFGDGALKRWVIPEPETTRTRLTAGCEFLVIASDGLWNKVSNQEAVDAVSRSRSIAAAAAVAPGCSGSDAGCCKELVDMARGRGSRDDITVMVVDLKRFLH